MNKEYLSVPEMAKLLGISRIAVYQKVKRNLIQAIRIGRNYAIPKKEIAVLLEKTLSEKNKAQIRRAVQKTIREYGETLRLLGRE